MGKPPANQSGFIIMEQLFVSDIMERAEKSRTITKGMGKEKLLQGNGFARRWVKKDGGIILVPCAPLEAFGTRTH